jgi:predicted PurR-regulated permease PerM
LRNLEDKTFLLLLAVASLALLAVLWPLSGAILWGTVLAILFNAPYRRLSRSLGQNLGALATILIIVLIVILPLIAVAAALVREATGLYEALQQNQSTISANLGAVAAGLPDWLKNLAAWFGLTDLSQFPQTLASVLQQAVQFLLKQALAVGQSTVAFALNLLVMIYLLFFLLRDGEDMFQRIKTAIPLKPEQQNTLFNKFAAVVRATVKGDILVAVVQGALGGLIFWALGLHAPVLWAVVMSFLSLLPVLGSMLVWFPAALYLLVTGWVWQGVVLIGFGALVIGLIDNLLRPALVGRDARLPDYVVLLSTLGGLQLFGVTGFVLGPVIAAVFIAVWEMYASLRNAAGERSTSA